MDGLVDGLVNNLVDGLVGELRDNKLRKRKAVGRAVPQPTYDQSVWFSIPSSITLPLRLFSEYRSTKSFPTHLQDIPTPDPIRNYLVPSAFTTTS